MTLLHLLAAVIENPLAVEYNQLAAAAARVKTVAAGFGNMSALKEPETAAASVIDAFEHCFAQPSLAPTAVKLEQAA